MATEVLMTLTAAPRRPTVSAGRFGYVIGILINAALLYAANVWPGWEAVPFLTEATVLVIGLVNASILVNLAANLVYLMTDPPWLKALGTMLTTAVGILAMVRIWQVFPFDFDGASFDWSLVVRILLGLGIVGGAIGIIAAFVSFVRSLGTDSR
jgi:hypothetical protein